MTTSFYAWRLGQRFWLGAILAGAAVSATFGGGRVLVRSAVDQLRYGPGISNHPVHVRPSRAVQIPEGWPLDHRGAITCLTCHRQLPGLRDGADPMLRGATARRRGDETFCMNCHKADAEQTAAGLHWMALDVAHVKPEDDRRVRTLGRLDEYSRRCLECHDGVNGIDSREALGRGHGGSDLKRNHPVGVRYRDNKPRGARTQLRSMHMLPAEVRLPGGRVSCVSCHDPYSQQRYQLTVPIERSELCFTCHPLD